MRRGLQVALLVGWSCVNAFGADWTGFRGPSGASVSDETNLPIVWNETTNVLWSTPLPGFGNSSPAVTKSRVYVTSYDETTQQVWLIAIDRAKGQIAWQHEFGSGKLIAYGPPSLYEYRHNPATPSPCADADERVYAFAGTGELVCADLDGGVIWQRNLVDDYGPYDLKFGMGSSPRLWGDKLIIACVHKGPSYVLALNKYTGDEIWLADRNYPALGDATDAYTSPMILAQPGLPPQVIVSGCDHVDSYDLESGRRLWTSKGLELQDEEYARIIASPAVGDGMVVAASAKAQFAIALRADGSGDVTDSHQAWKLKQMADCPTPTIADGLVYSVRDDGVGTCIDLADGSRVWRGRIGGLRYQASPVVADGHIYFLSLEGRCTVVKQGREFEIVAENEIPGDFYATPAISDGMIFLRDRAKVYAIAALSDAAASTKALAEVQFTPVLPAAEIPANITLGAVSGVACDSKDNVYVLQRAEPPVLMFAADGKFVRSFGDGMIGKGHGISVDGQDNIWVTDTVHHTLFRFDTEGKLLGTLGEADKPGLGDTQFDQPTYVAFGLDGQLFVMDGYGNSRIVRYSPDLKFEKTWGEPGNGPSQFKAPHAAVVDRNGRLIVADRDNERIQIFDRDGQLLDTWTGYKPFGIAQDADGRIFISDGNKQQIMQLDDAGAVVNAWGGPGEGPGEFKTPHLITADSKGNIYIAEVGGKRLQKLKRQ